MNNPSSSTCSAILFFFSPLITLFTNSSAVAENDDNPNARAVEEMIVVAHHTPTTANLIGSSISALDTEDFSDRITFDPAALFRSLPSLNVSQTGPFGGLTEVRVRGSESNHTLVLIDGVEANDPANGAAFNLATLSGTSIKRIEVLRGPQSARYGSEAIGGVIAITTRDGSTDLNAEPSVGLGLESGSHGFHQGRLSAGFQQLLKSAKWRNHISATHALTNGSNASFLGSESDGCQNRSWNADSTLYWPDDGELGLSVRQTRGSTDGDPQDFAFPATPTQGLVIDGDENNAVSQRLAALRGRTRTGAWLHEIMLSQNASRTRFRTNGEENSGLRGRVSKVEWTASRAFNSDVATHSLALGMQYEQRRFRNFSASFVGANHRAKDQQRSQFIEYLLRMGQRSFSVSARHDNNQRFANLTTWRVTATQAITANTRTHASWGQGSANPTFFELFGFIPDSFLGNPDLKPETSRGWDLGLAADFCNGACRADITYFRSTLNDEVTTTFTPPTFLAKAVNIEGSSRRDGWEATFGADIGSAVALDAHWTWLYSEDAAGEPEVRRPRRSGGVNLGYAFAGDKGRASVSWVYHGDMQDNEFILATPEVRANIKGVSLVNLGISYEASTHTTAFVRAQNVLDKEYQQVLGFKAPGATASIGVILSLR